MVLNFLQRHQTWITDTDSVSLLLALKNIRLHNMFTIFIKIKNRIAKTRTIKVKNIENEEILIVITIIKMI